MSLNWNDLRSWDGSQNKAFEELCCQLAGDEPVPVNARFVRKGGRDAGVECFWVLPDGTEHGWQAKFFFEFGDTQVGQLNESVEAALARHPALTRYVICMPFDLEDPRYLTQSGRPARTAAVRWAEALTNWTQRASARGQAVRFERWGQHEIWNRLTGNENKNRGRLLYWFEQEWFDGPWFERQVESSIASVHGRYLPDQHIETELQRAFEALGRSEHFYNSLMERAGELRRCYERLSSASLGDVDGDASGHLGRVMESLLSSFPQLQPTLVGHLPLPINQLVSLMERLGTPLKHS